MKMTEEDKKQIAHFIAQKAFNAKMKTYDNMENVQLYLTEYNEALENIEETIRNQK